MDMLHQMLEEKLKMDIYDLHEHLMERYGIRLPFDKLVELIRKSDLYYDTIIQLAEKATNFIEDIDVNIIHKMNDSELRRLERQIDKLQERLTQIREML